MFDTRNVIQSAYSAPHEQWDFIQLYVSWQP